ncbi:hypothetical protein Tco_1032487 [Tanacetum coccineum]|uniref:Uncharacterized protein n=1 Tax=Tanacetum coccineum TaxID=301880 RepID=A0ABQ5GC17_9ASTR
MNQNHFEHNSNYSDFDQPSQYSINHQEDLNQQRISDVHNRWDKLEESHNELLNMLQSICEMVIQQKQTTSIDQSPLQEMSIQEMEDLKKHYLDEMLSLSNDLQIKDYRNEKIDIRFRRECKSMIDELKGKFNGMSIEINKKKELQHLEQVANLSTYPSQCFKSFCYDDDDDYDYKESTIPLNEIDSQIPSSIEITPVLPTLEPGDSLIMGNEELSTILEKESDKFIKSSVEDLVPIPSESEDTSESDSACILPSCDDLSPLTDDESLSDKDIPEDNVKIYSNLLFEFDDKYISSDVNPLFDVVLGDIESKDPGDSDLDEPALLVTPLSDFNEDECFDPGGDVDEIKLPLYRDPSTPKLSISSILEGFTDELPLEENDDLFDLESKTNDWKKILYDATIDDLIFDPRGAIDEIDTFLDIDISTDIEDGYHDSEGDILYLESLLSNDTIPSLPPKVFLDHDQRSLSDINDLKIMVKVFDPGIHEKTFSPTYVSLPFEVAIIFLHICNGYQQKGQKQNKKDKTEPENEKSNSVVKRQNRTLVEVARTMPIFSKAPVFLWAEVVATVVFGALCYPINDSENLGKSQPTADIGIFVGYAPSRKGLVSPTPAVQVLVNSAGIPSSTTIDQDAPSPSHSPSSSALQYLSLHQGVAAESTLMEDNPFAPIDNNPFINVFAPEPSSEASSSRDLCSVES